MDGVVQSSPAPRFPRKPSAGAQRGAAAGAATMEILRELSFDADRIAALEAAGAI